MLAKQRGRILIMLLKRSYRRQVGVSLIELMIGMVIGLIIVGAAGTVYVNAVRSGSDTLRSAKLNIELRGAMDMMVAELRRAGYSSVSATVSTNPFMLTNTNVSLPTSDCILFAYDSNGNGTTDTADFFGFKKNNTAISMRLGGTAPSTLVASGCAVGSDSWENITDPKTVVVDTLTFSLTYQCVNAQTNVSSTTEECKAGSPTVFDVAAAASPQSDLVEIRNVTITLIGHHISDSTTTMTLSQSVRIRNDRIQTVGL